MYGSGRNGASEQTMCVYSSKERERGRGGWVWPEGIPIVITDHTNVCLEAAVRSEGCVSVLGWEHQVSDCRAVREQRLSVKQDYTITPQLLKRG